MPRIFAEEMFNDSSESVIVYVDKHTPFIDCESVVKRNAKMKVKVYIGNKFVHPNTVEHYFSYIQLWNLEKLIAEIRLQVGTFGDNPMKPEVDFFIVPKLSMRLTVHAYCTKHGLWKSSEVYVKVID